MSPISLVLELALAALLVACLFYCWRLDRKLSALRKGEAGIRAAAAELSQAVAQADIAIKTLRVTAQESGRDLQARIDAARGLVEPRTPERRTPERPLREPARRSAL